MNKIITLIAALLFCTSGVSAAVTYTKQDMIKVTELLKEGIKQPKSTNLMIYYGKKFLGVPYVGHTLEVNPKEQLVVNLRELDCTTFTETVLALALTTSHGQQTWNDYLHWLEAIRYTNGKASEGYVARNHYFQWWVERNQARGFVTDITASLPQQQKQTVGIHKQKIYVDWMTTHTSAYKMLHGNQHDINIIGQKEHATNGKIMYYVPISKLGQSKSALSFIHDGDILALATNKKGLDTTHIGIAIWGSDGKLHLLNASSIHKKVLIDPTTLQQYMTQRKVQIGVWVIRPRL